jgi:hypothetical protein
MHFYWHALYIHNLHYAELEAVLSMLLVGVDCDGQAIVVQVG